MLRGIGKLGNANRHWSVAEGANVSRKPQGLVDKATFRQLFSEDYPLTDSEAKVLLAKHDLGRLLRFTQLRGGFTNSVFHCETTRGEDYVLKIQFRAANETLRIERDVTSLLRNELPVAPLCILDEDRDVVPHPCLISSRLPGELAEVIFESSGHEVRLELSRRLGEILATIHSTTATSRPELPASLYCLNRWRENVIHGLTDLPEMKEAFQAIDSEFFPRLYELLDHMPQIHVDEELCLVWGDPKFHNFLVLPDEGTMRPSGVFDFQTAGIGNPVFDTWYLEGNFRRSQADGIYRDQDYVGACFSGYSAIRGRMPAISEQERRLCDVVLKANGGRWWWVTAGILPPRMGDVLNDVLDDLEWLKVNAG